jgi:hypothetical protein
MAEGDETSDQLVASALRRLEIELDVEVQRPGQEAPERFSLDRLAASLFRSGLPFGLIFPILGECVTAIKNVLPSEGKTIPSRRINEIVFSVLVRRADVQKEWAFAYKNLYGEAGLPVLINGERVRLNVAKLRKLIVKFIAEAGGYGLDWVHDRLGEDGRRLLAGQVSRALEDLGVGTITEQQLRELVKILLENPHGYGIQGSLEGG